MHCVLLTHLAFHRVADCDVSFHGKCQRQPDSSVADRVRQRARQLHAVALIGQAVLDRHVVIQRHCKCEDEIEKVEDETASHGQ